VVEKNPRNEESAKSPLSDDNLCLYQLIGAVLLFKTSSSKNLIHVFSFYSIF